MDQQWRQYLIKKKQQKAIKKREKLLNSNLTETERMKLLVPVKDLIVNL